MTEETVTTEGGEGQEAAEAAAAAATTEKAAAETTEKAQETKKAETNGATTQIGDEAWYSKIEDKKQREFASRFTTEADMAKAGLEFQQKLSKAVSLPGKNATAEEIQEFSQKAFNVPEEASGYDVSLPEDFPEGLKEGSEEFLSSYAKGAFEVGSSPEQVRYNIDFFGKWLTEAAEASNKESEKQVKAVEAALKKEWGKDGERLMNAAKRAADPQSDAAKALGLDDPAYAEFFETAVIGEYKAGTHPLMVKLLANASSRLLEAEHREGMTGEAAKDAETKIQELTSAAITASDAGDKIKADRLFKQAQELGEKLDGTAVAA